MALAALRRAAGPAGPAGARGMSVWKALMPFIDGKIGCAPRRAAPPPRARPLPRPGDPGG